ncbi:hypothetical protein Ping_1939 [Psychromonas ingrahamii 37]|uniref:Lipoprotein n=2 Tax=Psychromonas ingrahamii TaxID=357794 RepID=A1SW44_PSYIN|nr:hypothetical protein Ping_1939 [Psychromonas ingrahamii 37]
MGNEMKINTFILFLSLVLTLSGCVPNAVTYYRPAAEGGYVHAKGFVPTVSLLDIVIGSPHQSVHIRAWANDGEHKNIVYIGFSGCAWNNINFTSTDFKVIDLDNNIAINVLSVFANKHDSFKKLNTIPYAAPHKTLPGMTRFSIDIQLPNPMPKKFELLSPLLIIDGEKITLPTIRFEQQVWVGISPLNC